MSEKHYHGCAWPIILLCLVSAHTRSAASDTKGSGLLRFVARGHRANLERIITWRGRASVVMSRAAPREQRRTKSAVSFAYDQHSGSKRWNWTYLELRRTGAGQQMPTHLFIHNVIVKGGVWFRFDDDGPGVKRILAVRQAASEKIHNLADDFDPTYYLSYGGDDLHDYLMHQASLWEKGFGNGRKMKRSGETATYEQRLGVHCWHMVFDLSKGCNPVSLRCTNPSDKSLWTYEYEHLNGAFVPRVVKWAFRGPQKTIDKKIVFDNELVNGRLDEDEFAPHALGIRSGDEVQDRVLGMTYTYGEPDLDELGLYGDVTDRPTAPPKPR